MFEKRIYIYAFNRETGDLMDFRYLRDEHISVKGILMEAMLMNEKFQGKENIWICDGTREIADAARTMNRTNLFEDKVIFRMLIEENGVAFNIG